MYQTLCSLAKVQRKLEMRYSKAWTLVPADVLEDLVQSCLKIETDDDDDDDR